jgi:cytochrome c-type biogenesis protein CcmH
MTAFIILAALTVIAVVAMLLLPLRRAESGALIERREYDLTVYRDQLKEVERDLEQGLFTPEEAEAARIEIQRRMLAAAEGPISDHTEATPARARATILAIAVILPWSAAGLYMGLGAPGLPDLPITSRQDEVAQQGDMSRMVTQLRQRLEQQPDDVDGWMLLGRSYLTMGSGRESAEAFARAADLSGRRADVLAAWAEAVTRTDGNWVNVQAKALFEEALRGDPQEPRSRFYLGLAKAQNGDVPGAIKDWQALAADSPPDAPWMPLLNDRIRRAAAEIGVDPGPMVGSAAPPLLPSAPPAAQPPMQPRGPTTADMEAASRMSAGDRQQMIRSMVDGLAERLKENPNDRDGWLRLGRSYQVLGETAKAEEAFARARALGAVVP